MYKLCFYVPQSHLDVVKQAVFDAGAGRIGNYENCCWQVEGQGQFRPLAGSNPAIGQLNQLETVVEYRVEMVCGKNLISDVINALKRAHPYEEPAYDVVQLAEL
ncbi:MAG: YqfO family protein [Gammaproteobacteria bacterium]|nr:YqfO family protein [Gammaproteobacteria bacterium]